MGKIIAVYKPKGPTSYDIIRRIKKITGIKKVGHAGTLDPLARGVLVVGIGREATRKLHEAVKAEKEYIAKIKLGMESTTDDAEGEKKKFEIKKKPALEEIEKAVGKLEGIVKQRPPAFSAVKIHGREAYKLARKGIQVRIKPRKVEIKEIEIISYRWPYLKLKVITGPGVYIRSLARDLGRRLKTGGYLADLERIRVGDYAKNKSLKISEIIDIVSR